LRHWDDELRRKPGPRPTPARAVRIPPARAVPRAGRPSGDPDVLRRKYATAIDVHGTGVRGEADWRLRPRGRRRHAVHRGPSERPLPVDRTAAAAGKPFRADRPGPR